MASKEATTRQRIKTIAETVLDRVDLGRVDLSPTEEFFKTLVAEGPRLVVKPARTQINMTTKFREYRIDLHLWFGFHAFESYDFTAIEDVLYEDLVAALTDEDNYTDCPPPIEIDEIGEPEL